MLTAFGEGLACKYYDAHDSYYVRLVNKQTLTWLVMNKNVGVTEKPAESKSKDQVLFDRCREVTIRNGVMNCDCGRTQQFLMPCSHICAVIKKKDYMDPSFYHVRWYKTFAYYWKQPFSTNLAPNVEAALNQRFEADKQLFSKTTGNFEGINVRNSLFLNNVELDHCVVEDEILEWMKVIREQSSKAAIPKGKIDKEEALKILNASSDEEYMDDNVFLNGLTQNETFNETFSQLSQQREEGEMSSLESSVIGKQTNEYTKTFALCTEAFNVCRNQTQHKALQDSLQQFIVKTVHDNNRAYYENNKGTTFFGGDIETRRKVPRCMSKGEQYKRKSHLRK